MHDEPSPAILAQDINAGDLPQGDAAEGVAPGQGRVQALTHRLDRLESDLAAIVRHAALQDERHCRMAEDLALMRARLARVGFGSRMVNVRGGAVGTMQEGRDAHAVMLNAGPLPGARTDQHSRHLLIPIHAAKLNYVAGMFSRLEGNLDEAERVRCTFITTTAAEQELVERYIRLTKPALPKDYEVISAVALAQLLEMNDLAEALLENRNGGIINMKKLLESTGHFIGADEICCVDSDSIFLRPLHDVFYQCRNNYEKKTFIAVSTKNDLANNVIISCSSYFSDHDRLIIDRHYEGHLYSWFFDIPYFTREDIDGFLEHIHDLYGNIENSLIILTWHHFDYILYMNYLMLRGDFKMIDASGMIGEDRLSDELSLSDLKVIEEKTGIVPAWASGAALIAGLEKVSENGFYAISHIDRLA